MAAVEELKPVTAAPSPPVREAASWNRTCPVGCNCLLFVCGEEWWVGLLSGAWASSWFCLVRFCGGEEGGGAGCMHKGGDSE